MVELSDKAVGETKTCTHNFAPALGSPSITIVSSTNTKQQIRLDAGAVADFGATALVIGLSQAVGQTLLVQYSAGLEGNRYRCIAFATCSDGQVLESCVEFFVRDSAA